MTLLALTGCSGPDAGTGDASPEARPAEARPAEARPAAARPAEAVATEGVRRIPITTPKGEFAVWTRRVGENPRIKVLLLHGGPGMTHEAFEIFDEYLPAEGIEYYYYDQLGSHHSDQPDDDDLWTIERFVDEVEQVRTALGLDADNFFLYGQSWGGLLALEYALVHPEALKGLVLSNMMASIPEYNRYADEVLAKGLDPDVLAEIRALEAAEDFEDPRYHELVQEHYYPRHLLRMPIAEWPDAVNRTLEHANLGIYVLMQGPSEFGARGRLERWDRRDLLATVETPTLVIGATHDTMDPEHLRWMAEEMPNGRYHHCPDGSHLANWDDSDVYFEGLVTFLKDVDAGRFPG
ncbi:MAG: proline iminopeptidase-family hydrolase [Acidobacteriota bacterium]